MKPEKSDDDFWCAVGNMVRDHVDREIKNLRAEFEMKLEKAYSAISYQGTHEPGHVYTRGMFVTANGSLWHCNNVTRRSPGDGSPDWTLSAKRGRDGRDGKDAGR